MKTRLIFALLQEFFTVSVILSSTSHKIIDAQCQDICNPAKCCMAADLGAQVPDPLDCFKYYMCLRNGAGDVVPSDQSISCVNGFHFDSETSECVTGTDCLVPCNYLNCRTVCTADFQTVVNLNDCSSYYVCLPGQYETPPLVNCTPSLPYFDGITCTDNQYMCCDTRMCTPYCVDSYTEIIDPYDCEAYYICTSSGSKPSENYRFSCPTGKYFDPIAMMCQPYNNDEKCKSIC